ncbi:toll/interleukin-1 receptor domain-containing protein [Streptomyces sp. NPDC093982]|uniref:toll/interleukin-1 receptor domain-containing protein n=1 Tax=Streptomyces sp. NPDC093982 TaxID=3155077 RepID=UPI0034444C9F
MGDPARDKLVERLFDKGLDTADAVVVVVSTHSVTKPWVREELDAATVRRVNEETRLIPVRLDQVSMPPPLQHIAWITTDRSTPPATHQELRRTLEATTDKVQSDVGHAPSLSAAPSSLRRTAHSPRSPKPHRLDS